MTEHSHIMGGSTAAQRINCPGSYLLEQQMPEKASSEFADRGSMLHAAMELLLLADPKNMKEAQPLFNDLEGQNMGFEGHEITAELIADKLGPALQAWFEIDKKYQIRDIFIEQRVSLEVVIPGAFGTADILGIDAKKRLHVLDWKFGDGVPVPVEGNLGAGFYAAAALYDTDEEVKDFIADMPDDQSLQVVLHIIQPIPHSGENALQTWETDGAWIEALIDQAVAAIEQAHKPGAPTKPGPWCRWCSAKPICPAHTALASEALGKAPESMTAVDLSDAMHKADLLKDWITAIYDLALQEMEGGAAVPGYKLVEKRATRQWVDAQQAEEILKKSKIKVDDMYKKTLMSPTQIEKKHVKLYTKKLTALVEKKSSGVTIAPDSDKRPAVTGSMQLLANALPENSEQET